MYVKCPEANPEKMGEWMPGAGEEEGNKSDCSWVQGFVLGWLNVPKLIVVMAAQLCDYTENQ